MVVLPFLAVPCGGKTISQQPKNLEQEWHSDRTVY